MSQKINLLTFNVGLMLHHFLGIPLLEPVPYMKQRINHIPKALTESEADIIALQEVFHSADREFITRRVKKQYPYTAHRGRDGLVFLSKYRITDFGFVPFRNNFLGERILIAPGILWVRVDIDGKLVNLFNVRITAGSALHKHESKTTENMQLEQVKQLLDLAKKMDGENIVMGDFNSGPTILKDIYDLVLKDGYKDVWGSKKDSPTWEPDNILSAMGYHKDSPPQRIDHVFVPPSWTVDSVAIVFDKAVVKVKGGIRVALSDHYGLQATVRAR